MRRRKYERESTRWTRSRGNRRSKWRVFGIAGEEEGKREEEQEHEKNKGLKVEEGAEHGEEGEGEEEVEEEQ